MENALRRLQALATEALSNASGWRADELRKLIVGLDRACEGWRHEDDRTALKSEICRLLVVAMSLGIAD